MDAAGFLKLDRHVEVTLHLRHVSRMRLSGEGGALAVLDHLLIRREGKELVVEWDSHIGPEGLVVARAMEVGLRPGDHRPQRSFV